MSVSIGSFLGCNRWNLDDDRFKRLSRRLPSRGLLGRRCNLLFLVSLPLFLGGRFLRDRSRGFLFPFLLLLLSCDRFRGGEIYGFCYFFLLLPGLLLFFFGLSCERILLLPFIAVGFDGDRRSLAWACLGLSSRTVFGDGFAPFGELFDVTIQDVLRAF